MQKFYHYHTDEKIIEDFKKLVDTFVADNGCHMVQSEIWEYSTVNALQFSIEPSNEILKPIIFYCKEKIEHFIDKEVSINAIWSIYGDEHAYHKCHNHLDGEMTLDNFASVLYLEVPKNSVNPYAGDLYYFMNGKVNHFHPQKGDLIIFPIDVFHGTYPQEAGLRHTLNMDWIVHN